MKRPSRPEGLHNICERSIPMTSCRTHIIPRAKHRPDCYFKEGKEQVMVSPGSLDMGGMIITPRKEDFDQMNAELAKSIIQECGMSLDAELGMVMKFKSGK